MRRDVRDGRRLTTLSVQRVFDCLDHETLSDRLLSLGVWGLSLKWIEYFLTSRTQESKQIVSYLKILNRSSEFPKGSVLGWILFILYENSLTKTYSSFQITRYADDSDLIFKNKSKDKLKIESFLHLMTFYQYPNIQMYMWTKTKQTVFISKITDPLILSYRSLWKILSFHLIQKVNILNWLLIRNSWRWTYDINTFLVSCKRGLVSPNLAICYQLLPFYFKFSLWKVIIKTVSVVHVG